MKFVLILFIHNIGHAHYKYISDVDGVLTRLFSSYQLNAHFLYSLTIYMLHYNPQHVSSRLADCSPLSTGILYGRLQGVTIPEAVIIQFVLLKMSKVPLETC